ncbi:MAG: T9SS type A sorting domain-containing protein [Vicingus serpentipes]|nr:T9SS type A sorting domain-containing protein [Vicingus serpentipes]
MKKNLLKFILLLIISSTTYLLTNANTLNVPAQHTTIQAALNNAVTGDTVLVQPGTYLENITWPSVNGIVLLSAGDKSNTTIDGNATGRVIYFPSGTNADTTTIIKGFTITNGLSTSSWYGAGIYLVSASPLITDVAITANMVTATRSYGAGVSTSASNAIFRNVRIADNLAQSTDRNYGGGLYANNSNLTLENVEIANNILDTISRSYGGGIYVTSSSNFTMRNVSIINNEVYGISFTYGGGVYLDGTNATMTNVLIASNYLYKASGTMYGGGIYVGGDSTVNIMNSTITGNYGSSTSINGSGVFTFSTLGSINLTNTILWNDQSTMNEVSGSIISATYSDIRGGLSGVGNIDLLPDFVSVSDFHLNGTSPCVNTGTATGAPTSDIEGTLRDANPDMGAYERVIPVGIKDNQYISKMVIYPNPATDIVKINMANSKITAYQIYDLTGKQIISEQKVNQHEVSITRNLFPSSGIYFISVTDEANNIYSDKLIFND